MALLTLFMILSYTVFKARLEQTPTRAPHNSLQWKGDISFGDNRDYRSSDKTHIQISSSSYSDFWLICRWRGIIHISGPLPGNWLDAHIADLTPDLKVLLSWESTVLSSFLHVSLGLPWRQAPTTYSAHPQSGPGASPRSSRQPPHTQSPQPPQQTTLLPTHACQTANGTRPKPVRDPGLHHWPRPPA